MRQRQATAIPGEMVMWLTYLPARTPFDCTKQKYQLNNTRIFFRISAPFEIRKKSY
jgi:hypothetical protein